MECSIAYLDLTNRLTFLLLEHLKSLDPTDAAESHMSSLERLAALVTESRQTVVSVVAAAAVVGDGVVGTI